MESPPAQRAATLAGVRPVPSWRAAETLRSAPRALGLTQSARIAACALAIGADVLWGSLREPLSSRSAALRDARRRRSVARAVRTLGALKGAFAKVGQFAAARHDLLPAEATAALALLRDRVPPLPFSRIRSFVERELAAPLETLFAAFEPEPLGAASMAQVHRARLQSGEPVAVKVQYPWLVHSLPADLTLVRWLLGFAGGRGHGWVDRERLFDEFATGLREELDFEREARIASEIAANLENDSQVAVPRVVASHSTRRVFTMSYWDAIPVGDTEGLARLGVDPAQVLEIVGRSYAKQIFADGLFHADPHPGNLFVIDEPEAARGPRVLFVDFGLSRRLDPELRREMRRGIYSVLQRDLDGFVAAMQRMGMVTPGAEEGVREKVAAMFERMGGAGGIGVAGSQVLGLKDEAVALLRETRGLQLPNDLLLYAKTMSYVFTLGAELAPEVDLLKVCLPQLLQFLAERDDG